MNSRHRARWAVLLACAALVTVAAPASAQTQSGDAVLLARTLADGFTAIEAHRPQARAAVHAWYTEQGRCAEPARIRSRFRRSTFTAVRWTGLHMVALRALAPDLEQLTRRRAAQRALLRVEVDPRLARSLDSVFEHATAGLYRSRLQLHGRLAPPFPIVTDAASLERLRKEAASVAATTGTLFAARRDVTRRLSRAQRRIRRCEPAIVEAVTRRPRGAATLLIAWSLGELSAATERPLERFRADLAAVDVTDPALRDLLRADVRAACVLRGRAADEPLFQAEGLAARRLGPRLRRRRGPVRR